ncbi:hypothetical protein Glove_712g28 [Diversispora epigaea]|uniref:Cardiolipin synthase N-terminal domain-containing protein n=1 Tax=Diversispora epigaea TaxID=1348612 RepID=A0A397G488_9GLOM|nr:hypothetical protein Glove_712g28 [Diversispora epigaea]
MSYTLVRFIVTVLSILVLILDIIAIWEVIRSDRSGLSKLFWCLLIFFFPYFGLLIYLIFGKRKEHQPLDIPWLP